MNTVSSFKFKKYKHMNENACSHQHRTDVSKIAVPVALPVSDGLVYFS